MTEVVLVMADNYNLAEDAVALVLRKRRDLMKQTDDSERTALHSAVLGYCRGFINQILMEDASIACIPDNEGLTPLLRASAMGSWIICRDIIKLCPESVEARDNNGKNALHIFTPWSSFHFKRFLGIKGAKELVNERDNDGNTPLHLAIKSREYQKSRLLIGHTNLKAVNKSGKTALDVCESDWINSHRQRQLATRMISLNASRGRCPDSNGFQYTGPTEFSIKKDEDWRAMSNTLSVVAALLVTVTFSAIFTMPGGYNSVAGNKNLGIATLARKTAFQIFVLSDTVAMCTSIIAVFMSVWAQVGDKDTLRGLTITCLWMIRVALCTTLVAFATGLYSVTADRVLWIAILVIVICFIVPLVSLSGFPLFLGVKGFHRLEVTRQEDDDDQDIAVQ